MGAILSRLVRAELFQLFHPFTRSVQFQILQTYPHFPYRSPVWITMHDKIIHAHFQEVGAVFFYHATLYDFPKTEI